MRLQVFLDEPLPRKLAGLLQMEGCPAHSFPSKWKGMLDGMLLDALDAEGGAILLTCDRNMPFQQSLGVRRVALVVLPGQRLAELMPLVPSIAQAAAQVTVGDVLFIDRSGRIVPDAG